MPSHDDLSHDSGGNGDSLSTSCLLLACLSVVVGCGQNKLSALQLTAFQVCRVLSIQARHAHVRAHTVTAPGSQQQLLFSKHTDYRVTQGTGGVMGIKAVLVAHTQRTGPGQTPVNPRTKP